MSTERPLVSIGLPVKNGEGFIDKALDCLLAQTYENLELIISDNASDDNTGDICLRYAEKDQRIIYRRQDQRVGAQKNFDHVARQARGEYFMWAAADDLWAPRFVEMLVKELEAHPESGLAMSALEKRKPSGELVETIRYIGPNAINDRSYLWVAMKTATATTPFHIFIYGLFRTPLLIGALDVGMLDVPSQDRIFMMQIALSTSFRYVDEVLHTRTVYDEAPEVRHAGEDFIDNHLNDHLLFTCSWMAIEPYLWESKIIPEHRKPMAALLAGCFADSFQSILYRKSIGNDYYPSPEEISNETRSELVVIDELSSIGAHAAAHKLVSALALSNPNSPQILLKLAQVKLSIGHQKTAEKVKNDVARRWPQLVGRQ